MFFTIRAMFRQSSPFAKSDIPRQRHFLLNWEKLESPYLAAATIFVEDVVVLRIRNSTENDLVGGMLERRYWREFVSNGIRVWIGNFPIKVASFIISKYRDLPDIHAF